MAISTQTQNLNLIPGKSAPVVVHLSQGNVGNTVQFYLYNGADPYIPSNVSIAVHGVRADGSVFGPYTVTTTTGSNLVSFSVVSAMTSVNGAAIGELVLTDSNQNQISTANFGMLVEATPYSSSVTYEDDLSIYQRILAYVQSISAGINDKISVVNSRLDSEISSLESRENSNISELNTQLTSEINALKNSFGSPLVATTKSAMTDTSKVYVYTGSESGYTNGNWYYYNGLSWVSGGVYNSTAFSTDTTLTVSGQAADAYVTGQLLSGISSGVNLFNRHTAIAGKARIYSSGNLINNANYIMSDYIPITGGEQYYIANRTGDIHICFFNASKTYVSGILYQGGSFSAPSGSEYMVVSINKNTDLDIFQISNSSSEVPFEPFVYKFDPSYDDIQDKQVDLVKGNNLLNPNTIQVGKACQYTSGIFVDNSNYMMSDYIPVAGGVFLSLENVGQTHVCFFDSYKRYISGILSKSTESDFAIHTQSFTTPNDTYYVVLSMHINTKVSTAGLFFKSKYDYYQDKQIKILSEQNIFKKNAAISGEACQYTSGNFVTTSNFSRTDYLVVIGNTEMLFSNIGQTHICFFDGNKVFLSGKLSESDVGSFDIHDDIVTIPTNAVYMIASFHVNTVLDNVAITFNSSASSVVTSSLIIPSFDVPLSGVKLLLLGDSITHGAGATGMSGSETFTTSLGTKTRYSRGNSWAIKLRDYLADQYPNITLTNNGWGGITWEQLATYISEFVPSDTTHCIIGLGVNSEGATSFDSWVMTVVNYLKSMGVIVYAWGGWLGTHPNRSNINTAGRVQAANISAFKKAGVACLPTYSIAKQYLYEHGLEYMDVMEYQAGDEIVHPNDLGHEILFNIIRTGFGF